MLTGSVVIPVVLVLYVLVGPYLRELKEQHDRELEEARKRERE